MEMFSAQNLYLFFLASLLLNITPGNDMMFVASRTISQGTKAGMVAATGVFAGCFVHILGAVAGLSFIIAQSPVLFNTIRFIGAGYLIYLGVKAINDKSLFNPDVQTGHSSYGKLFKQGVITNALNPKVAIFFLSFLPQFISPASVIFKIQLFTLGIWFALQGTLVLIIVAILVGHVKTFFNNNPKVWAMQQKVTGLILISLGIKVALAGRR